MTVQSKYFYLISSVYSIIKVAWFIGDKLKVSLSQRPVKIADRNILVFEAMSDDDKRISLYRMDDLKLRKLKNFDYLLVLENVRDFDVQKLRNSQYINFVTKLDLGNLTTKSQQYLSLL